MGKHTYLPNQKRIVQVDEFANHLADLANRIRGVDIRKMVLSK